MKKSLQHDRMECSEEFRKRLLPKHAAVAGWKHRALSLVEREGVKPMPKDRGTWVGAHSDEDV